MVRIFGRRWAAGFAILVLVGAAHWASGQVVPQPGAPGTGTEPGARAVQPGVAAPDAGRIQQFNDHFLASWLAIDNNGEIALSRLGEQHASHQDVKNFSQMMVREHTDFANRLQQAVAGGAAAMRGAGAQQETRGYRGTTGGTQGSQQGATQGQPGAGQAGTPSQRYGAGFRGTDQAAQPGAAAGGLGAAAGGPVNPLRFKQDIAQRALALTERDLNAKQGAKFDHDFMHVQIGLHTHMMAGLQSARDQVSPQMRPVIDQGITSTQKHLDEARSILARLEGTPGGPAAAHQQDQRR